MKRKFGTAGAVIALVAGAVACSSSPSSSGETEKTSSSSAAITTPWSWTASQGTVSLIPASQGFCYYTSFQGAFDSENQHVRLEVNAQGIWTVSGTDENAGQVTQLQIAGQCNSWSDFTSQNTGTVSGETAGWSLYSCPWDGWFGCQPTQEGNTPIALANDDSRLCYVTGVGGMFNGQGEFVRIDEAQMPWIEILNSDANNDPFGNHSRTLGEARCVQVPGGTLAATGGIHTLAQGSSDFDLMPTSEGICAITGITGRWRGEGERAIVRPNPVTGNWQMHVESGQIDVAFSTMCVPFSQTTMAPPPDAAPPPPPDAGPAPFPPDCNYAGLNCYCPTKTHCEEQVMVTCATDNTELDFQRENADGSFTTLATAGAGSQAFFSDYPGGGTFTYRVCSSLGCSGDFPATVPATCSNTPADAGMQLHCPKGYVNCGDYCSRTIDGC